MVSLDSILVHNSKLKIGETKVINGIETTRVGRWMSKIELEQMQSSNKVVAGAGDATSVSIKGADDFRNQAPAQSKYYVEFDVPANSLTDGGTSTWRTLVGPNANRKRLRELEKLGGEFLPDVTNIKIVEVKP